jgi:hypothetical protein
MTYLLCLSSRTGAARRYGIGGEGANKEGAALCDTRLYSSPASMEAAGRRAVLGAVDPQPPRSDEGATSHKMLRSKRESP